MPYNCEIKCRPGKDENPADFISRNPDEAIPLPENIAENYVNYLCNNIVPKAITLSEVKDEINNDSVLQKKQGCKKRVLCEKVWFPSIDKMVENRIKTCITCQAATQGTMPRLEPLNMTPLPKAPWKEIAVDFVGPFPSGELLLVLIDEYSRFPEVEIVHSTSAMATIPKLDGIFSRQGIPDVVKSDNGPPFNSDEFANFASFLGFEHRKVTPY